MTLSEELRKVVIGRIEKAPAPEILQIVSTLCSTEPAAARREAAAVLDGERFAKINQHGDPVAGAAAEWVAVLDRQTGLIWQREALPGSHKWVDAKKVAASSGLLGLEDWRLPTIAELLSIVDYTRSDPAIDTTYFSAEPDWFWTRTPVASSPSDCAWFVNFYYGYSAWVHQKYEGRVRAVRASQSLGL